MRKHLFQGDCPLQLHSNLDTPDLLTRSDGILMSSPVPSSAITCKERKQSVG